MSEGYDIMYLSRSVPDSYDISGKYLKGDKRVMDMKEFILSGGKVFITSDVADRNRVIRRINLNEGIDTLKFWGV